MNISRVLLGFVITVVVIAVIMGLIVLGSPAEERTRLLDQRRVENLRGIARALDLYWTRHERLPTSLDELMNESGVAVIIHDPTNAQPYAYRVLSDSTYELCAHFERDWAEEARPFPAHFWSHGSGRHCFEPQVRRVRQ